ncbi:MAG: damage-inducible protein DinB [Proteobacteria bacterium]|nr:MAG: damage-inducible protein DinB [Pseudomonadota bacterium]
MSHNVLTSAFLEELKMESLSTRKCLERIPAHLFAYKPHERSMEMGYLAALVAAIPMWIVHMVKESELDLGDFGKPDIASTEDLLSYFDTNLKQAENALEAANDKLLDSEFSLKMNGETLYTKKKREDIATTLNHWVHHRGQLTVYMRLNDILVPSIYGPSADDRTF